MKYVVFYVFCQPIHFLPIEHLAWVFTPKRRVPGFADLPQKPPTANRGRILSIATVRNKSATMSS